MHIGEPGVGEGFKGGWTVFRLEGGHVLHKPLGLLGSILPQSGRIGDESLSVAGEYFLAASAEEGGLAGKSRVEERGVQNVQNYSTTENV